MAQGTGVGTYCMRLTASDFEAVGEKVGNYNVTVTVKDGCLKIAPKSITPTVPDEHVLSISRPR